MQYIIISYSGTPPKPPSWAIEHLYGGSDPFKNSRAKGKPTGIGSAWRVPLILLWLLVLAFAGYVLASYLLFLLFGGNS